MRAVAVVSGSLAFVLCACGASAPGPGSVPPAASAASAPTDTSAAVTPEPPLPPTALAQLGAREEVVASDATARRAAHRAIADVSPNLVTCFRASLDRDPALAGAVSFSLQLGSNGDATGMVERSGDLASLPSMRCAAEILGRVSAPGARGRVAYTVTFTGKHRAPEPPRDRPPLAESLLAVDWAAADGKPDPRFAIPFREIAADLRRCVALDPARPQAVWMVARVGTDGVPLLEDRRDEEAGDEASLCVRRKLAAARLSDVRAPFAASVLLGGPLFGAASVVSSPTQPQPAAIFGRDDSFGAGGLGLIGVGEGGGGRGEGVGSIGVIGSGGRGSGSGQGFGRLGSSHKSPPRLRMGQVTVHGRLPPEVIQRIVRQNFGRFRLCYETGLRSKPTLQGRVVVSFVIGRDGSVGDVKGEGDMPDKYVISCVARAFHGLSFPQPEGGVVKVSYPLIFKPGDDVPPEPKSPPTPKEPTVDGTAVSQLDAAVIQRALVRRGMSARLVPTASGGQLAPIVFARDTSGVYSVRIASKAQGDPGCSVAGNTAAVIVTGPFCKTVLDALVD